MSEKISTGTTTLGIVCKDGIVMAADKRATMGHYVAKRNVDKVIPINDSMAVTIAGTVSDAQLFLKLIKAETRLNKLKLNRNNTAKEVANLIGNLTYQYLRSRGSVTAFVFGAVNDDKNIELYQISPDGVVWHEQKFITTGSGGFFADSVLESKYKSNMTLEEGIQLAKEALNVSLIKDSASGNGADIFTLTKDGVKKVETMIVNTGLLPPNE